MITVLFACVHNAGRSQRAAAGFNALAEPARARAESAGTHPADQVHSVVASAMREAGIELSGARPQRLTETIARRANWLITMGCGEECPVVPGVRRDDWAIDDPAGLSIDRVREIRDAIKTRVETFVDRERFRRP